MYDNIGRKIKGLAKAVLIIGVIVAIFAGMPFVAQGGNIALIGLAIMIIVPIFSWIFSWFIYGFGELIDKVCDIEHNTSNGERKSKAQKDDRPDRIRKIERLHLQGLISEEEYRQALSKEQ